MCDCLFPEFRSRKCRNISFDKLLDYILEEGTKVVERFNNRQPITACSLLNLL